MLQLDFLYTGEMKVYREDTSDLQLLIETLQIDPELISVDVIKGNKGAEISNPDNQNTAQNNQGEEQKVKPKDGASAQTPDNKTSSGFTYGIFDNQQQFSIRKLFCIKILNYYSFYESHGFTDLCA